MNMRDTLYLSLRQQAMDRKSADEARGAEITHNNVREYVNMDRADRNKRTEFARERSALEGQRGDPRTEIEDPYLDQQAALGYGQGKHQSEMNLQAYLQKRQAQQAEQQFEFGKQANDLGVKMRGQDMTAGTLGGNEGGRNARFADDLKYRYWKAMQDKALGEKRIAGQDKNSTLMTRMLMDSAKGRLGASGRMNPFMEGDKREAMNAAAMLTQRAAMVSMTDPELAEQMDAIAAQVGANGMESLSPGQRIIMVEAIGDAEE